MLYKAKVFFGIAFIVCVTWFERGFCDFYFTAAYKHADGKKIDGRRVLVDVERARTVKGWLPRRLGKLTLIYKNRNGYVAFVLQVVVWVERVVEVQR